MKNRQIALAVILAGTILLSAACQEEKARQLIDTRPIGDGLQFFGMMVVLAALVFVFGKFVEQPVIMRWIYLPYVLVALLIILALLVVAAAIPSLLIPFGVAVVLAVAMALAWHHWK